MTMLRPRLLAALCAALLCIHFGCEPLDSDMQGDAQQEPGLEDEQATDAGTAADTAVHAPDKVSPAMSARLDTLDAQMRDTREQLGRMRQDLDELKGSGAGAPSPSPDAPGAYKTALEQFFNHQYEESAAGFRKVLDEGSPVDLQSNCQYWIGECEYGMHQYQAAINAFRKVFSYSASTKYDDAQMMLGMSYLRMNNRTRAKKELRKLIEQYPESEFVPRAKRILTAI